MQCAIISDIHSNIYALRVVVEEIKQLKVSKVIVLGDTFGYYPWAVETFDLLSSLPLIVIAGNHDQWVLTNKSPIPVPKYWKAAQDNSNKLLSLRPQAIDWLRNLQLSMRQVIEGREILLVHGTPDNPSEGRFYPDDHQEYSWFPLNGQVLMLGHTHYPLYKVVKSGGVIINPGSVGQPRDGNPASSWCVLETDDLSCVWKRTEYDYAETINELVRLGWEDLFIKALKKDYQGPLR